MDQKRILVFVDKWIGLECAEAMLAQFPNDKYTFILGPHDRETACEKLLAYDYRCSSKEAIEEIRSNGRYDWLLNLWGHDIFRKEDLAVADRTLNIHPGLLPNVRGSDPVVWTMRLGLPAGATLHELTLEIDGGPIYSQVTVPYSMPTTGGELYKKVVRASIDLFKTRWPEIRNSPHRPSPQIGEHPIFKRKQLDPDRRIAFDETISKLLAHDFNDGYRAIVTVNGIQYHATLNLSAIP